VIQSTSPKIKLEPILGNKNSVLPLFTEQPIDHAVVKSHLLLSESNAKTLRPLFLPIGFKKHSDDQENESSTVPVRHSTTLSPPTTRPHKSSLKQPKTPTSALENSQLFHPPSTSTSSTSATPLPAQETVGMRVSFNIAPQTWCNSTSSSTSSPSSSLSPTSLTPQTSSKEERSEATSSSENLSFSSALSLQSTNENKGSTPDMGVRGPPHTESSLLLHSIEVHNIVEQLVETQRNTTVQDHTLENHVDTSVE